MTQSARMAPLGIIVNPMSGRDVRRIAARASTSTHEQKLQQVTRLVLGAQAQGVSDIYLVDETFRISRRAVENLDAPESIHLIRVPFTHTAEDSRVAARMMWEAGCRTFIVLGGDGTNRVVSAEIPDAALLPLSTGTNNVFPFMVEASVAGAAAGLVASGKVDPAMSCIRTKRVHVSAVDMTATALVDAALIANDVMGSLLPFEPANLQTLILARAEPASIGMSPIGGYLEPCYHEDEDFVFVRLGEPAIHRLRSPISAGLYGDIAVSEIQRYPLGEVVRIEDTGIVAFDGDREMVADHGLEATVRRDGPWLIEPARIMADAVRSGVLSR